MSFSEITELVASAQDALARSQAARSRDATQLLKDARLLLDQASSLAETTQPEVIHPREGLGVVVGVTRDGLLEVTFGREPWAVALDVDQVKAL